MILLLDDYILMMLTLDRFVGVCARACFCACLCVYVFVYDFVFVLICQR